MNPASVDIKDILEAETALGLTHVTNLFIGKEPASPLDCVTIFDTPGLPPQLTFNRTERYEYPSIQIRVRNSSYASGWDLAQDIVDVLHGRAHETWNAAYYSAIICTSGPALLDWDERGKARFIINFGIQRR